MRKLSDILAKYNPEREILLGEQHHGRGHLAPVQDCPVCYNVAVVGIQVALGYPVPSFELDTIMPHKPIGTRGRRVGQ